MYMHAAHRLKNYGKLHPSILMDKEMTDDEDHAAYTCTMIQSYDTYVPIS